MMLISLVENADQAWRRSLLRARHHHHPRAGGRAALTVSVADTGEGIKPKKGGGVGLTNIRERLKALYGAPRGLVLRRTRPAGVVASIEVRPRRAVRVAA